jgi:cytochrome o ubiquinol oxidase subunit 3
MNSEDSKTNLGFWVYLMTDCLLFGSLFATFAVLRNATFGGPSADEIFSLPFVLLETLILLTSSFTAGLAMLAVRSGDKRRVMWLFGVTFLLGASFVALEVNEFASLIREDHSWRVSAFLTAFFTLVATHGLHVTIGLLWMALLLIRLRQVGLTENVGRRLGLLAMFWHFLDIVWIFIFTIVYLMGVAKI